MKRDQRLLVRPRFLVAALLTACILLVAPVSLVLIVAKIVAWQPLRRAPVWTALSFLPALVLAAVLIHLFERRRRRWSSTTILLLAVSTPTLLILVNFLAVAERTALRPRLTHLPRALPMIVLGAALFGLTLVGRTTKSRILLASLLIALAGLACAETFYGSKSVHSLFLRADRDPFAWKIPAAGELLVGAALLASMRRLRLIRLPMAVIVAILGTACFVILRQFEFPRSWRATEIRAFSGARLAANGDLYLLGAREMGLDGNDRLGIFRRLANEEDRFVRVTRRPVASSDSRSPDLFSPDLLRVATAETASPWLKLLFRRVWVSKIYDVARNTEETVPADEADPFYFSALPPRALPGSGASWALVVEGGIAGHLISGRRFRVPFESRIERIWIERNQLRAFVPAARLGNGRSRTPSLLSVDLVDGDTKRTVIPLEGASWLWELSPSGRELLLVRAAGSDVYEWSSWDEESGLRLLKVGRGRDVPATFWLRDGTVLLLPREKLVRLFDAVPHRWMWNRNWLRNVRLNGRQIGGSLYIALPATLVEIDREVTRAKALTTSLVDHQWLPDSILFCEDDYRGSRVVRYWPAELRKTLFSPFEQRYRRQVLVATPP